MRWPVGFQAMVRMLVRRQEGGRFVEGWGCGRTYVWEPGPREVGSWYVWTLRVGKRVAKRSLATGLRGWGGAIVRIRRGWGDAKDFVWLQDLASGVAERMKLAQ